MTWTIVTVAILVIATGIYFALTSIRQKDIPVMQAVPEQTVLLARQLEIKKLPFSSFLKENFFRDLAGIPLMSSSVNVMLKIDSLLAGEDKLKELLIRNELLLALVPESDSALEILVLFEVQDMLEVRKMNSFLTRHFKISEDLKTIHQKEIHRIDGTTPFFFCLSNGIFAGSASLDVLEMAVVQMNSKKEAFDEPGFKEIIATSGKNVHANLYIDLDKLNRAIHSEEAELRSYFGKHSSLDILIKEDGIMLNGFLNAEAGDMGLAELFEGQEVVSSACPVFLPASTQEFFKLGFTDFDSMCCSLARMKKPEAGLAESLPVSEFEKKHFTGWATEEMIVARTGSSRQVAAFYIRQDSDPLEELEPITLKSGPDTYLDTEIRTIYREGMIRDLLWPFSRQINMPYYCILGDYVLFGNSKETLQHLIRNFSSGKTLGENKIYTDVSAHTSENSHIQYFVNLSKMHASKDQGNADPLLPEMIDEKNAYLHFPALSGQFTLSGKWLYTSLFLAYSDTIIEEGQHNWEVVLDSKPVKGPFVVRNPQSAGSFILINDLEGNLYLVSSAGKIVWRRNISGQVLGEVSLLDTFMNGIFLFNTASQMFMLDMDGKDIEGFPVTFDVKAAAGLKPVHYRDVDEIRILVPGIDGKIYNYYAEGEKVKGWKEPEMPGIPSASPQYLVIGKKDYLIFPDEEGNVLITDRRGKERARYKGNFANSLNSGLYVNRTNSRGLFLTTDQKGHLIYVPEKGKLQETVFGEFSPDHYFFYVDMNGDGSEDFVYFDRLVLQAYDRFKKKLFDITLPEEPVFKPLSLETQSKQRSFLFQGPTGQIYRVDHTGTIHFDEEIKTDSGFHAWKDPGTGMVFIFTTKKDRLYSYSF
jgi:hypothetical protein